MAKEAKGSPAVKEEGALAIAALCIGGMVVARSLNDDEFSNRLRAATTKAALAMGGWSRANRKQARKRLPKSAVR